MNTTTITHTNNEELKVTDTPVLLSDSAAHTHNVRLAVIGNVDSGKSTLVGVLSKGMTDDGRGSARLRVMNYPHEADVGRTSSICHEIMGFDANGAQVLPDRFTQNKNKYWNDVVTHSHKVVTLMDLCGHEKYLKTTMFGLVGMMPDYAMIIVGANMGVSRMTKEHLGICLALKIPVFVVVTKVDMCPDNVYKETMDTLLKVLKSGGCNRKPIVIKTDDDVKMCAGALTTDKICPIFTCSSVTGHNIDTLTRFIYLLTNTNHTNKAIKPSTDHVEFDVSDNFMVPGVGVVVSGVVKSGTVKPNTTLLLGPDKTNRFKTVIVKTIHVNRVHVDEAHAGTYTCLSIRPTNKKDTLCRDDFRKGMTLIDPALKPKAVWEFEADMTVLHHATTIKEGYQAVMHCGVIRQAVTVEEIPTEILRTGDKSVVRFRFAHNAEYMKAGQTILLRENRTKMLGIVTKVYDTAEN